MVLRAGLWFSWSLLTFYCSNKTALCSCGLILGASICWGHCVYKNRFLLIVCMVVTWGNFLTRKLLDDCLITNRFQSSHVSLDIIKLRMMYSTLSYDFSKFLEKIKKHSQNVIL